ncbi:probable very-long-chain enoyl-CoA reductase art-1, partial [Penaeus japonicus]|uniref:probable very-long-chain enoyl-CoA reductase art-1 n=1 Tax=Penaeus japonicus TaxID=27405 RepID=UPI001C70ED36
MELEKLDLYNAKSGKFVTSLYGLKSNSTVLDVKKAVHKHKSAMYPDRQEVRLEQKGKGLKDSDVLEKVGVKSNDKIYVKDLGPQIGWKTVFIAEYAGPLAIYLWLYQRPWLFYGDKAVLEPISMCTQYVYFLFSSFLLAGCMIQQKVFFIPFCFMLSFYFSTFFTLKDLNINCDAIWELELLETVRISYDRKRDEVFMADVTRIYVVRRYGLE